MPIVKGVDVPAGVETSGSTFVVKALTDRFIDDNCSWGFDGVAIVMSRGDAEVGYVAQTNQMTANAGGSVDFLCAPAPPRSFCTDRVHYRQYEEKLRAMYPTAFTPRVEQVMAHNDPDASTPLTESRYSHYGARSPVEWGTQQIAQSSERSDEVNVTQVTFLLHRSVLQATPRYTVCDVVLDRSKPTRNAAALGIHPARKYDTP